MKSAYLFLLGAIVMVGCAGGGSSQGNPGNPTHAAGISEPPAGWNLSTFYKKAVMVDDFPILSSDKVSDAALLEAKTLTQNMVGHLPGALATLAKERIRGAIMAPTEKTLDIPEHSDLQTAFPDTDWNTRARGLGASLERPAVSCGEENLLQLSTDPYKGENIWIHEFGHTLMDLVLEGTDPAFPGELESAYANALATGLWKNTYALSNISEYWATGTQCYFDAGRPGAPAGGDGVWNNINSRDLIKDYDPAFYALLARVYGADATKWKRR